METGEGDVVLIRSDETMPKTSFTVVSVVGVQWRRTPSYKDRIDGERLQLGDTVTGFEMLGVDGGRHLLVASDNPDENEKYLPLMSSNGMPTIRPTVCASPRATTTPMGSPMFTPTGTPAQTTGHGRVLRSGHNTRTPMFTPGSTPPTTPMSTPGRSTPHTWSPPVTGGRSYSPGGTPRFTLRQRRRRNAVACIDISGTIAGLTELDGLFGGKEEQYVSLIRLIDDPVLEVQRRARAKNRMLRRVKHLKVRLPEHTQVWSWLPAHSQPGDDGGNSTQAGAAADRETTKLQSEHDIDFIRSQLSARDAECTLLRNELQKMQERLDEGELSRRSRSQEVPDHIFRCIVLSTLLSL